ncbi:hypothetical protein ACFC36_33730 [Streptomyces rubiginosohelvolus]|uniref:hypothetical protein n=1 Tax=Streptomyces rubiginosohelvolus TaxID=67362 RepID=UPI0035E1410B
MPEVEAQNPIIRFPRRMVREFKRLLNLLHEQGLTWLTITDVIENLGAVARWSMRQEQVVGTYHVESDSRTVGPAGQSFMASTDLLYLCAEAGWAQPVYLYPEADEEYDQPLKGEGRDHTTPAALAVYQAKERLAAAMLADSAQGASANTIAGRASKAQSRPTTLKVLAVELLQRDAERALEKLLETMPLQVGKWGERTVVLRNHWSPGGTPHDKRLDLLERVRGALHEANLQLHDVESGEIADIRRLAGDRVDPLEVRRVSQAKAR